MFWCPNVLWVWFMFLCCVRELYYLNNVGLMESMWNWSLLLCTRVCTLITCLKSTAYLMLRQSCNTEKFFFVILSDFCIVNKVYTMFALITFSSEEFMQYIEMWYWQYLYFILYSFVEISKFQIFIKTYFFYLFPFDHNFPTV